MCHRIKGGVIKNGNPGTVVSKPGYTLGSTNVAIEKWTLNEDDSPNENGDIPASYVSLPESKLGISPFSLGESSSFMVHSPIAMLVYQRVCTVYVEIIFRSSSLLKAGGLWRLRRLRRRVQPREPQVLGGSRGKVGGEFSGNFPMAPKKKVVKTPP